MMTTLSISVIIVDTQVGVHLTYDHISLQLRYLYEDMPQYLQLVLRY